MQTHYSYRQPNLKKNEKVAGTREKVAVYTLGYNSKSHAVVQAEVLRARANDTAFSSIIQSMSSCARWLGAQFTKVCFSAPEACEAECHALLSEPPLTHA